MGVTDLETGVHDWVSLDLLGSSVSVNNHDVEFSSIGIVGLEYGSLHRTQTIGLVVGSVGKEAVWGRPVVQIVLSIEGVDWSWVRGGVDEEFISHWAECTIWIVRVTSHCSSEAEWQISDGPLHDLLIEPSTVVIGLENELGIRTGKDVLWAELSNWNILSIDGGPWLEVEVGGLSSPELDAAGEGSDQSETSGEVIGHHYVVQTVLIFGDQYLLALQGLHIDKDGEAVIIIANPQESNIIVASDSLMVSPVLAAIEGHGNLQETVVGNEVSQGALVESQLIVVLDDELVRVNSEMVVVS
jgi:hypothetical protein